MTDDAPLPKTAAQIRERLQLSRETLERTVAALSEAQLVAVGAPDGWSVKDHLAHLATWQRGLATLLQKRPRCAAMGLDLDTFVTAGEERINAIIHDRNESRPLAEVLGDLRQSETDLDAALADLTDADLLRTYSHFQPDEPGEDSGAPILGWIAGNSYAHYEEHLPWIQALMR